LETGAFRAEKQLAHAIWQHCQQFFGQKLLPLRRDRSMIKA